MELKQRPRRSTLTQLGCATLMAGLFGFTAICSGMLNLVYFATRPGPFLLAALLATACTVPYAVLVSWVDRHEPEPFLLLASAFSWGAVGSIGLSLIGNMVGHTSFVALTDDPTLGASLTAVFVAPFVEESTKALGLVTLYVLARHEFDNVVDGVLYGAMVGLGFAWVENVHDYLQVSEHGVEAMFGLAWVRGELHGIAGHATFTGLTGAGFGLLRVGRTGVLRWGAPVVGLGLAMLSHGVWNAFAPRLIADMGAMASVLVGVPMAVALFSAPFMLLLLTVLVLALRHEEQIIYVYLSDEPSVREGDVEALLPMSRRRRTYLRLLFEEGLSAALRRHRRNRALVDLAFSRWHHDTDPACDWPVDEDAEVAALRSRLA
jgi:RsiW-degrading membrane proteinase PrsW (M82 family)